MINPPELSPEFQLILTSLRWAACGPGDLKPLPEVSSMNWEAVVRICQAHRVLGFVAYSLEANGVFPSLDPKIRALLSAEIMRCERENRFFLSRFKEISLLFSDQNIPILPLKGIDLSFRVYRNLPFRQMGDLDLLIRETDLGVASTFLFGLGYRLKQFPTKNRWHDRFYSDPPDTSLEKIRKGRASFEKNGLDVDLHWHPRHAIGADEIEVNVHETWSNSSGSGLARTHHAAAPMDAFWHLFLHHAGEMHAPRLLHLLDLASSLQKLEPSERETIERRVFALTPALAPRLRLLLENVTAFLQSSVPELFVSETPRYRYDPLWKDGRPIGKRSLPERLIYAAGYIVPNPDYYAGRQKGAAMYIAHWKALGEKLVKILRRRP